MFYKLSARIEGPSGPLNPALVGSVVEGSIMTIPQATATFISYLAKAATACMVESLFQAVTASTAATPGAWGPAVEQPLPTDELDDWHTIDSDSPTPTDWGFVIGAGTALASVGTSVNVGELTAIGGRHNGRHFLPWIKSSAINGSGLVTSTVQNDVSQAYQWRILGTFGSQPAWWGYSPVVEQVAPTGAFNGIAGVAVRAAPARLRSRVR